MDLAISWGLIALVFGFLAYPLFKGIWRTYSQDDRRSTGGSQPSPPVPSRKTYVLKSPAPTPMEKTSKGDFSYEDEYRAATARQRVWIQYEDRGGNITERKIEIYHPEDDDYVFAWCCSRQEPRTFSRWKILAWRLLPEHFEFDPIVERYWREEGTRGQDEKVPWRRWITGLGSEVAVKYGNMRQRDSSDESEGTTQTSRLQSDTRNRASSVEGSSWWDLQNKALLAYSKVTSSSIADYQEVIRLATASINGGASVYAQARLNRVLGEIYQHCGQTKEAIDHLERAIRLDPGIGVKKLLARLKAELST